MELLANLYRKLRYEWRVQYLWPCLILLPLFFAMWSDPLNFYKEQGTEVSAEITSIHVGQHRYTGRTPGYVVVARTSDGVVGRTTVLPPDIEGCEVGDPIRAEQVNMKIYLYPAPCSEN